MRAYLILLLLLCCPQVSAWAGEASETVAVERPKATNSTEVAPPQAEGSAVGATPPPVTLEVVGGDKPDDKQLGLRHLMTYEPLERTDPSKQEWIPDKVFFLSMYSGSGGYGGDAVIDTNVGFGVVRGASGTQRGNSERLFEIACYEAAGDNCSPEAIIVYDITGTESYLRTPRSETPRLNLTNLLYQRVSTTPVFQTKNGAIPAEKPVLIMPGGLSNKNIRITYVKPTDWDGSLLSLTFPLGEGKEYSALRLITSAGHVDDKFVDIWSTILSASPRWPDTFFVDVFSTTWWPDWYTGPESPFRDDRAFGDPIIIYEAKALRRGRWVNILPRLVNTPLVQLPVHSKSGPLPVREEW